MLRVRDFCAGVFKFFGRLIHDLIITGLLPFFFYVFYPLQHFCYPVIVGIRESGQILCSVYLGINLSIDIQGKAVLRHYSKRSHASVSNCGAAPLERNVAGAAHRSYYGKCICLKSISNLVITAAGKRNRIPDLQFPLFQIIHIHRTFVFLLRETSFLQLHFIHGWQHGHQMHYDFIFSLCTQNIRGVSALRLQDSVYIFNSCQVIICKPHSTHNLDIHQIFRVKIGVPGITHIRLRRPDTGKKSAPDSHNEKNGQETPHTAPDFHIKIFSQRFLLHLFPYHSISSIDIGCSFVSIFETCPFFICISRSAIGAIAWLWVITITVIPRSLHIF